MATTTNFGIYYPVTGDALTPLESRFASLAQSVDDALNAGYWRFGGLDATRVALSGVKLKEGVTWYSTDTNREWRYDGTAWLSADDGMYLIQPTSVAGSGVTLGSDGSINFSGATAVSVNGVFSSRFSRYRVNFDNTFAANQSVQIRLRAAGTDNSTASSYSFGIMGSGAASATGANDGPAISLVGATRYYGSIEVRDPALAAATGIRVETTVVNASAATHVNSQAIVHTLANAYDGMTLLLSAASSGSAKFYGYA